MTTMTHPTTVTRIMSLAAPADDAGIALAQGQGVLSVEVVKNRKALRLTYDLKFTELEALAHLAEASRSQIKVVHRCCSTPPRA